MSLRHPAYLVWNGGDDWAACETAEEAIQIKTIEHMVYQPVGQISELMKAAKQAHEALCRATFPGPRDKRDLNEAIDALRKVGAC